MSSTDAQVLKLDQLLYGRSSAAAALDIHPRSIDLLIKAGELQAVRIGRRVLITAESLKRFAGTNRARIRPTNRTMVENTISADDTKFA